MMEDEIIIIAPPFGEPGDWTDPIGLDQVLASPILCRLAGSGTQKTFDDALRAVGADPERINVRARLESPEAMKAAVAHGAGIAAVSALVAAPAIADGSVRGFRVEGLKMKRKSHDTSQEESAVAGRRGLQAAHHRHSGGEGREQLMKAHGQHETQDRRSGLPSRPRAGGGARPGVGGGAPSVYFDNAATSSPKPPQVLEAMEHYMKKVCASPGRGGYR